MTENPNAFFAQKKKVQNKDELYEDLHNAYEGNLELLLTQLKELFKKDNDQTIGEFISRLDLELNQEQVELPKEDVQSVESTPTKPEEQPYDLISEYKATIEKINELIAQLNGLNAQISNTVETTTIVEGINKQELAEQLNNSTDLRNSIFRLKQKQAHLETKFFLLYQYPITLNKEMSNIYPKMEEYPTSFESFYDKVSLLILNTHNLIEKLKAEYDGTNTPERKQYLFQTISEYIGLKENLITVRSMRCSNEKDIKATEHFAKYSQPMAIAEPEKTELIETEPIELIAAPPTISLTALKTDRVQHINTENSTIIARDLTRIDELKREKKLIEGSINQSINKLNNPTTNIGLKSTF